MQQLTWVQQSVTCMNLCCKEFRHCLKQPTLLLLPCLSTSLLVGWTIQLMNCVWFHVSFHSWWNEQLLFGRTVVIGLVNNRQRLLISVKHRKNEIEIIILGKTVLLLFSMRSNHTSSFEKSLRDFGCRNHFFVTFSNSWFNFFSWFNFLKNLCANSNPNPSVIGVMDRPRQI